MRNKGFLLKIQDNLHVTFATPPVMPDSGLLVTCGSMEGIIERDKR